MKTKRVVVITGASSGIGLAAAKHFISRGDVVYNLSRTQNSDIDIKFIKTDVTKSDEIRAAFDLIIKQEKRIDVLINNAGIGISGSSECTKTEDIKKMFDVNFTGLADCCAAVIPHLRYQVAYDKVKKAKHARPIIINISSLAAVFPLAFQSFYSASKAAVTNYTNALRTEIKPFGIRTCSVQLGDIKTDFTANRKKNQVENDAYGDRIEKIIKKYEQDEIHGVLPEVIAKKLYRLSHKKNPKPVVVFGFGNKFLVCLSRILPVRVTLWILSKMYS